MHIKKITPAIFAALALSACGGGGKAIDDLINDLLSIERIVTLTEGQYITFFLGKGNYTADITSSNNGIKVQWIGATTADCSTKSSETKVYSKQCTMGQNGQITIENPTLLGLGGDEVVTVKIRQR